MAGKTCKCSIRLTDIAAKKIISTTCVALEYHHYSHIDEWVWRTFSHDEFIARLDATGGRITHQEGTFKTFVSSTDNVETTHQPIFMTKDVYEGFKAACPDDKSITNSWFNNVTDEIRDFSGDVYSGNVYYLVVEEVMA